MSRVLVCCYSRTGFTRRVAEALVAALDAPLDEIRTAAPRDGWLGFLRLIWDAVVKRATEVAATAHDPAAFDVVVLCTRVWGSDMTPPMRGFIAARAERFGKVAFLCTLGGSGAEKTFQSMASACGMRPLATLALTDKEIDAGADAATLSAFAEALRAAPSGRADLRA